MRRGGVIVYPTDTVWGIGCDATNENAVQKVFQIKKRSGSKSLIVLVSDEKMLNRFVHEVPAVAWDLLEAAVKPITIVYDRTSGLAPGVSAEDGSSAVRITKDEFCRKMISRFGKPVVSTSANISGGKVPGNFGEIDAEILQLADYVVTYRQHDTSQAQASQVIKLKSNGEIAVIRK